mgnify:CR=1 FL=1
MEFELIASDQELSELQLKVCILNGKFIDTEIDKASNYYLLEADKWLWLQYSREDVVDSRKSKMLLLQDMVRIELIKRGFAADIVHRSGVKEFEADLKVGG